MVDEGPRQPDAHKATHITVVGKKHVGKTELAWLLFESYPYDRVLIDPNGDMKVTEDFVRLEPGAIPTRWPAQEFEKQDERQSLYLVPDMGSPTFLDDMDRAVALAWTHRRTMVFADDCHMLVAAGQTPPHCRRVLAQGRHHDVSSIWASQRPKKLDPLVVSQADWLYVFKLPNPDDRKRVAEEIGYDQKTFDQGIHDLATHEYLRYDDGANDGEGDLAHFPALPEHLLAHHKD